jgi:hypothetical protein
MSSKYRSQNRPGGPLASSRAIVPASSIKCITCGGYSEHAGGGRWQIRHLLIDGKPCPHKEETAA